MGDWRKTGIGDGALGIRERKIISPNPQSPIPDALFSSAFTLVEMSIVLVIIGLLIGGIFIGQSLVSSAESKAQITQISKYNAAVNVFEDMFQALPGDIYYSTATKFGFTQGTSCTGATGARDGNGLLDGASTSTLTQMEGETALFWQDVSSTVAGNLIEGTFPNSNATAITCSAATAVSGTAVGEYLPPAKIGHGNFVYVYETSGYNWYGVSGITAVSSAGVVTSAANIPVTQAYNIDQKIDDGLPTTGAVQAVYLNGSATASSGAPNAASDGATTCYNTTGPAYSVSSTANYGKKGNCALSFQFQSVR